MAVIDRYVGELQMLDSGDILRVDQAELETVLPAPGGTVRVVGGPRRGDRGELLAVDAERFSARVRLRGGGEQDFEYEEICKLAV